MTKSKAGRFFLKSLSIVLFLFAANGFSLSVVLAQSDLKCLANDHGVLPFMNEEVIRWKRETQNQYQDRAFVQGRIVKLIKSRKTHDHLKIQIGRDGSKDTIEIVYNKAFGKLPKIRSGMSIEACGDYITAREKAGNYPPSPEGAIIHWVHINTDGYGQLIERERHEDGFLRIDGVVYGNRPGTRD